MNTQAVAASNANELVLGRTANLTGDVSVRALIVEEGAVFNGRCHYTSV